MSVMAPGGTSAGAETTFCVARAGVSRRIGVSGGQVGERDDERDDRQRHARDRVADGEHARRHAERDRERLRRPPGGVHPDGLHPHLAPGRAQLVREGVRGPTLRVGRRRCRSVRAWPCRSRGGTLVFRLTMDATDLAYAGAAEQARLVREGEVSAREVVEATLERIARVDPQLNAYRVVFAERALAEADQADARSGAGQERPLLGVPVAIKDDADVAGELTCWGGSAHAGPRPVDSDVVARLREAGAIIIGKTNVPELTIWPFTETVAFGAARNPWNTQLTPGGSSGGSGAAAAAGLCGVALGSDGAGSIRIPAAFNGLFGIKPQRDRISLGPDHHDAWHGLSVYGPLARSVADAALFLDATADGAPEGGYLGALAAEPGPLRIAISTKAPPPIAGVRIHAAQRRAIDETAELLRGLGHEVREHEVDYGAGGLPQRHRPLPARHPRRRRRRWRTPTGSSAARRRWRGYGGLIPDAQLARARTGEAALAARINAIFDDVRRRPDARSVGPAVPDRRAAGPRARCGRSTRRCCGCRGTAIWNAIGQPATSVPAGFDELGAPTAVQFGGRPGDEVTLLRLAAQIEAARPWAQHRPPLDAPAGVPA